MADSILVAEDERASAEYLKLLLEEMDVTERPVHPDEFAKASEAFLTSSTRDVNAIARVDDVVFPELPGPVTVAAQELFADLCARSLDP